MGWQVHGFRPLLTAIVRDDLSEKDVGIVEVARNVARKDGRDRVSNAGERSNVKSISEAQPAL